MLDDLDFLDGTHITLVDDAIAEGRIAFAVQGIGAIDDPTVILYSECLACLIDPDGTIHRAPEFVPYLEALGAASSLDRHMIKLALDELETDPDAVLGCNLSANNVSGAGNWANIYDQIAARSHLASRLVLEITETAPLASTAAAGDLLAEAKKLGCRIAIDDFGTGYSNLGRLLDSDADIVKIDALCMRDVFSRIDGNSGLYHMVGLAGCVAPIVVVEGIETAAHFDMAKASGASHVQGFQLSKPCLLRSHFKLKSTSFDPKV